MENNNIKSSAIIKSDKSPKATSASQPSRRQGTTRKLKARRVVSYEKKDKSPFPMTFVLGILTLTILVLFMMMNYAEIDKYNSSIADLKSRLTDLQKEADKLEQRLDRKNDLVYIEEYASEKMGMVNTNDLQHINVTLVGKDDADIMNYEDGEGGGIGVLLSGIAKTMRGFFN